MSLEQALADCTAAVKALTVAFAQAQAVTDEVVAQAKAASKPKAEKPKAEPKVETKVAEVRYFYREANDVVYRIEPSDPVQTPMDGSVEITADEFLAHQSRLSQKYESADKPEVTSAMLIAEVTKLSQKADAREQMTKILAKFGVPKFSLLPAQHVAEAYELVKAAL